MNERLDIGELRKRLRDQFPGAVRGEAVAGGVLVAGGGMVGEDLGRYGRDRGFPQGGISEVVGGGAACGVSLLVAELMEGEEEVGFPQLALVDGNDQFDPQSYPVADCARVLWLRCRCVREALRCCDLLLRDGNVPVILLDLLGTERAELRRQGRAIWHRFKLLLEHQECALVCLVPEPTVPGPVVRLELVTKIALEDFDLPREVLSRMVATQVVRNRPGKVSGGLGG